MFKFIAMVIVVLVIAQEQQQHVVFARPGDFTDAAENVDVPPEHRAAPPAPQPPQQYPVQPAYQPRAIFPAAAPAGPQYPLFFTTQNGFVPFGSIYNAYQQPATPTFILPQDQPLISPIVAAAL
ncbi:uncharacterized protein ACRADG_003408 [Cochliomyia hominivorax]